MCYSRLARWMMQWSETEQLQAQAFWEVSHDDDDDCDGDDDSHDVFAIPRVPHALAEASPSLIRAYEEAEQLRPRTSRCVKMHAWSVRRMQLCNLLNRRLRLL